jgi:hypothetical protein
MYEVAKRSKGPGKGGDANAESPTKMTKIREKNIVSLKT